ncbi:MAG TPA: hypothetical protein VGL40_12480 [Bacillota bacterium]
MSEPRAASPRRNRFPTLALALILVGLAGIGLFRFYTTRYYRPLGSASGIGRDGYYGWPMGPGAGGRGWGLATGKDIGTDAARKATTDFLATLNNPDLTATELWKFKGTPYYAVVTEKSTGRGAFEILVDRAGGRVYPEMGPNIMWNLKYGTAWDYGMQRMMGSGMMGPGQGNYGLIGPGGPLGSGGTLPGTGAGGTGAGAAAGNDGATMTVSEADARTRGDSFLKANASGFTLGPKALAFYGYYNFTVLSGGKPYGILSVNGFSGQVWFHAWHGPAEGVVPVT